MNQEYNRNKIIKHLEEFKKVKSEESLVNILKYLCLEVHRLNEEVNELKK